jgi:hypothetical protein
MPLTPEIHLTINLENYSGAQIGSAGNPAYVRVALCGFGPFLPRIPGTTFVGQVASWPGDIPYVGSQITVDLWGNDVITPVGTYYAIAILDASKNVLHCNAYVFTGSVTADLSTLSPTFPSYNPSVMGGLVTQPFSATESFDCTLVDGPIAFDLTLTGNVTSSVMVAPFAGQIVSFIITQDGTGGRTFAWPTNVFNHVTVNAAPNSTTVQSFVARANGNLYPIGISGSPTQPVFFDVVPVTFSATPTFTPQAFASSLFTITLTGNVTSSTFTSSGVPAGTMFAFLITQDGTGGHIFTWPAVVNGGITIDASADPNATFRQVFVWDGTKLQAFSAGVIYP